MAGSSTVWSSYTATARFVGVRAWKRVRAGEEWLISWQRERES